MGWTAQYFTTIIIEGNTPKTGIFIYNGTPSLGTLIGSWTASSGTDAFGNSYPAGLNVTQGQLQSVTISNSTLMSVILQSAVITNSTLNNSTINSGTIRETTVIFDSGGGKLFGYTSTTTTVSKTSNGIYTFTGPTGVTNGSVSVIGAGASGAGGTTTAGGVGGGGGEFSNEPNYPLSAGTVYTYVVGSGGTTQTTGNPNGINGSDCYFDINGAGGGVYAYGGQGNGTGGSGAFQSVTNNGGNGGSAVGGGSGGGGAGGNSGNANANGNNGGSASGNTGGAAPAAQTGSGTGGAGGNSGANGSNGGSPGGGGGGAGNGGSGTTVLTKTYNPVYTASYYGPDATNGSPNGLRSTSIMYQGGETDSGGSANGNQRCVMVFNVDQMASDFSGYTMTNCQLTITNQHSWYSSGMSVEFDEGSIKYPSSAPSTWQGDQNYLVTGGIAEGTTHTYSLGSGPAHDLVNKLTNFLGLGAFVAADYPYNLNYYGFFTGGSNPVVTLTGQTGSGGSFNSGAGSDGSVVITYSTSSALEFALAPVAGSDSNSNAYAAGYTGPVSVFQPNSSPTAVETWHSVTLANGWADQGFCRYKLIGYNMMLLQLQINDVSATSGTFMTMPTGYTATQTQFIPVMIFNNTGGTPQQSIAIAQVSTGAGGAIAILDWAKQSKQYHGTLYISLD